MTSKDRLALNYRSKISHTLEGTADFTVPQQRDGADLQRAVGTAARRRHAVPAHQRHGRRSPRRRRPRSATGIRQKSSASARTSAWTKWDVFKNLTVNYSNPAQPPSVQNVQLA